MEIDSSGQQAALSLRGGRRAAPAERMLHGPASLHAQGGLPASRRGVTKAETVPGAAALVLNHFHLQ